MSTDYIRLHYGPIKTLDGIVHRPQRIRGLLDHLQKYGFRVDTIPVHIFEYCMIELCGRNVFQCQVSNFGFNTHWSRDALCQTAVKVVLRARGYFLRVCVYQWLHSMLEESIFNRSKFAPREYCVENISDISSKDSTPDTTKTDLSSQMSLLRYVTGVRKSIMEEDNFKDTRQNTITITESSIFNNLLKQRFRPSNNMYDNSSLMKLNALESTLLTLVEQSSQSLTSNQDLDCSFVEQMETAARDRSSADDGHFLAVHSELNVARRSIEWHNDVIECPSQTFMQHFIAPTFQPSKSALDIHYNSSKDTFRKESSTPSTEENIILEIPKQISFGIKILDSLKETDEERETGSVNSKISV